MSNDGPAPGAEGPHELVVGLVILAVLVAAVVVLGIVAYRWADDDPGAALAGAGEIDPPVPLASNEEYVVTELLPSGDLMVTHWIESSERLDSVQLARPDISGVAVLRAEQVRVVADGRVAVGAERISSLAGRYLLPRASSVQIRYLLTGAVAFSSSAPGRALAWPTALDVSYEPTSLRVTRTVIAPEVLSLACSSAKNAPRPCGAPGPDGEWTVELDKARADDRVMAQLSID